MRVSTAQFYFQNSQQLSNKQSDINDQSSHISSGKRVHTAKDDAVKYGTLIGYKDELANIDKYKRNITQAKNRNSLQDTAFATAEKTMQELKRLFIQANNGTLSSLDLKSLAKQAVNSQSSMLDVANTKDETGSYIFSGYQTDTKPFSVQADKSVNYFGDNGIRELQIGKNVTVALNQSGADAFQNVPNTTGNFSAKYTTNTSGISLEKAVISNPSVYNPAAFPPDFKFTFTSATNLTVTDANNVVRFNTTSYVPGQAVAFDGIEAKISGNPLPGDSFTISPEENVSTFETIKAAIDWMNEGTTPANKVDHGVKYGKILGQINASLNHMLTRRTDAGTRMKFIETQSSNHLDRELGLASGRSSIEDIDFAKAVSNFEQSKVALQAAQQMFIQIKDLSLFNRL